MAKGKVANLPLTGNYITLQHDSIAHIKHKRQGGGRTGKRDWMPDLEKTESQESLVEPQKHNTYTAQQHGRSKDER